MKPPLKPSYQVVEQERDELCVIATNLHRCLFAAYTASRNAGYYRYKPPYEALKEDRNKLASRCELTYEALEVERDNLRAAIARLHSCLADASVSLRNVDLYPYPGRAGSEEEKRRTEDWMRRMTMPGLNATLQRQIEEDERRDRTEFLSDDLNEKGWIKYQQSQIYLACLRFGGNWNNDLHKGVRQ